MSQTAGPSQSLPVKHGGEPHPEPSDGEMSATTGVAQEEQASSGPSYPEITIENQTFARLEPQQQRDIMIELAQREGVLDLDEIGLRQLLFAGINGDHLKAVGTTGDARTARAARFDEYPTHSTLLDESYDPLRSDTGSSAVIIFDGRFFLPKYLDSNQHWQLVDPDTTMDDAVIAVFYIEN